jgi:hypothetical protein
MSRIAIIFLLFFIFSCSTQEDVPCESGFGYLYKDGREFACPFTLQIRAADKGWKNLEGGATILAYDVDDYFPLRRRNSPAMYRVKMNVLEEYFTEEQYTVSLWTAGKNHKACGETKEFIFYKVAENADSVEYSAYKDGMGKFLFLGEREMPSDDWYHVLKVCDGRKTSFMLMGEIKE